MHLSRNKPDIIIIAGCNSVGKSTTTNYLRTMATLYKIPHESNIVADSQCLFEAMQSDDRAGGLHHTHDWCEKYVLGHAHNLDQPIFPFIVTDNELPDKMRLNYFTTLTNLPRADKLWFVEWAAGVNTHPPEDPISCVDYSYAIVKKMLVEGSLVDDWINRIKAIVHLEADYPVRLALNKLRSIPSITESEALKKDSAFWLKDERVLRFYGNDDFSEIEGMFRAASVPIYTIINDGKYGFYNNLESVADKLFLSEMAT